MGTAAFECTGTKEGSAVTSKTDVACADLCTAKLAWGLVTNSFPSGTNPPAATAGCSGFSHGSDSSGTCQLYNITVVTAAPNSNTPLTGGVCYKRNKTNDALSITTAYELMKSGAALDTTY